MTKKFDPGLCSAVVLPSTIAIYGPECHQFFDIPEGLRPFDDSKWGRLFESWTYEVSKKAAAQLHRAMIVDKEAVQLKLRDLEREGRLSENDADRISDMVRDCDCPPAGLRKKLAASGFSGIMSKLPIDAPHPEMVRSLEALNLFLRRTSYEKGFFYEPKT